MTEQERPRTEAGQRMMRDVQPDGERLSRAEALAHILAIEAEGRQQAVPSVDELAQIIRRVDGNHSLGAGQLAERILNEWVAGLNASETMHDAFCILSRDHGGACDIPGLNASESPLPPEVLNAEYEWVGDASESGQPSEASDE